VYHWTFSSESPKANFGMDFINPLLTQRRDYIIHLLDLRSAAWLPQELSCCFVTCSGTVATIRSNGADAIDLLP